MFPVCSVSDVPGSFTIEDVVLNVQLVVQLKCALEVLVARFPDIVPISDLRQEAAALLKKVRDSREPVVVTQRGRAAAVLLSVEEYERRERDLELLRLLARGEKEIAAGDGFDLDDVMAEAEALLENDRP